MNKEKKEIEERLREKFERCFSRRHGNGFHALANDGKRSSNCEICAEDRELNPKGYYLTFLNEQKHYWNRDMMNDVADFWLKELDSYANKKLDEVKKELEKYKCGKHKRLLSILSNK